MIVSLDVPKLSILKVEFPRSKLLSYRLNFRPLVNLIDSIVNLQNDERVFDVSQIIEFGLL